MWSLLGLAVLVGMHHALEADHVAAVSSLASGKKRLSDIVGLGLTWGLGHTVTLFLLAGFALVLGQAIPETFSMQLEAAVGIMLVGLGGHVLWRLRRDRVHFHGHRHEEGETHFHAHNHTFDSMQHARSPHCHAHRFHWRTLMVGMTHGMAGSAALLLLTVTQIRSPWMGLVYVVLFGIGSMLGMAVVTAVIGVPLTLTAQFLTSANRGLQMAVGITTIVIGAYAIHSTVFAAFGYP